MSRSIYDFKPKQMKRFGVTNQCGFVFSLNEFLASGFVFFMMGGPLGREGNWAEEHGAERGGESVQGRREGKPRAVDEGRKRARIRENPIELDIRNETDTCVTVASQLRHSCVTVASQLRHGFCSIFPFS